MDWSYDLLFEDERRLFARLSVFVGGCELEAVEAVYVDDDVPPTDVLDLISRLVDKSLVTAPASGETRLTQLQTLWQGHAMSWEGHHIEVVRTAVSGDVSRATDLLREHLASVGCDPLALRIVTGFRWRRGERDGLDDLRGQLPVCHPTST